MSERYFGKVVQKIDEYSVVMNKGEKHGVKTNDVFLIVGLGDMVYDPETEEEIERLELYRGKANVLLLQNSITTLKSCEYIKESPDEKEIITPKFPKGMKIPAMLGQTSVTEKVIPGEQRLKELDEVQIGDLTIKV